MSRIAIEVSHPKRRIKFIGKRANDNWKVVESLEDAEKWPNMKLAKGAADQYQHYLQKKYPNTYLSFSLRCVPCE